MKKMNEGQLLIAERVERFKTFCAKFQRKHGWVIYLCKKRFQLGNAQCLEWVLAQYGGNVHEHDDSAKRLQGIHLACQNDNIDCLNVLIAHGADINVRSGNRPQFHRKSAQDRAHWLPIEFAIICKAYRCIQRLIEAGSQSWDSTVFAPCDWVILYIEQRKMEGLRPDHWQTVSKFLTIRDLCRLMGVSRAWFHLWVDDRLWSFQENRICAHFPDMKLLFDNCRTSKQSKKRRAKEWVIPRKGTWWAFKRWLFLACRMEGIKKLCKNKEMHPIILAALRLTIPRPDLIIESRIEECHTSAFRHYPMYYIRFWSQAVYDPGNRITYIVRNGSNYFDCEFYDIRTGETHKKSGGFLFHTLHNLLLIWRNFLFHKGIGSCWTQFFHRIMAPPPPVNSSSKLLQDF